MRESSDTSCRGCSAPARRLQHSGPKSNRRVLARTHFTMPASLVRSRRASPPCVPRALSPTDLVLGLQLGASLEQQPRHVGVPFSRCRNQCRHAALRRCQDTLSLSDQRRLWRRLGTPRPLSSRVKPSQAGAACSLCPLRSLPPRCPAALQPRLRSPCLQPPGAPHSWYRHRARLAPSRGPHECGRRRLAQHLSPLHAAMSGRVAPPPPRRLSELANLQGSPGIASG